MMEQITSVHLNIVIWRYDNAINRCLMANIGIQDAFAGQVTLDGWLPRHHHRCSRFDRGHRRLMAHRMPDP